MKPTNLQRYAERALTGAVFTEGEIVRGMRNALHHVRTLYNVTPDDIGKQAEDLLLVLDSTPRAITSELTEKGLSWFAKMHKADGAWRDTALTRQFSQRHRDIVDHFAKFTFEGYHNAGNRYRDFYLPIYRVWSTNGDSFAYCYGAWQSGLGVLFFD